jgi:cell division protein FtsL
MKTGFVKRRPVVNAYLVRERDRRRWRDLGAVLLVVVPVGLVLVLYSWIHLDLLRTGYRIDALEQRLHQLVQEERRLRLEASSQSSLERIEERARSELGMEAPSLEDMVFVEETR